MQRSLLVCLFVEYGITYQTAQSATGRVWLDRNIGASRVCTAFDDSACYGGYYQWGKGVNDDFTVTSAVDWRTDDNDGAIRSALWADSTSGTICPVGYRVPTQGEVDAERNTWDFSVGAFASPLKFGVAGYRQSTSTGGIERPGRTAFYFITTVLGGGSSVVSLSFSGSTEITSSGNHRSRGYSVRCIQSTITLLQLQSSP
ncbi:hypothetical protein SPONL_1998 [uncultured Candidatus Thioglobus sp.]|nr:hypothetical protein SPONL_1998 [uncultured Candidatus Thioglobus sp.]